MRFGSNDDANDPAPVELKCPLCGAAVPDWTQVCDNCGRRVRSRQEAARAEIEHIAYLRNQVPWLLRRDLLTPELAARIESEYTTRSVALERLAGPAPVFTSQFEPGTSTPLPETAAHEQQVPQHFDFDLDTSAIYQPPAAPERVVESIPPVHLAVALPFEPNAELTQDQDDGIASSQPLAIDSDPAATPMQPPDFENVAPPPVPTVSDERSRPSDSPRTQVGMPQANAEEVRAFFGAHGLKLIFALASMLVLYALKNLIAWQTVGAVVFRLVPMLLIGLTAMFFQFGSRSRRDNPWAAYVFHAMACVLTAFDVGAVNRFWLDPLHIGLPLKPALLVASGAATALSGLLLARLRRVAYLHLLETGALVSVYCLLQNLRLIFGNQHNLLATPLPLFGIAFLGLSGLDFLLASRIGNSSGPPSPGSVVPDGQFEPGGADGEGPVTPGEWKSALTLWANLSAATVALLSTVNAFLSGPMRLADFALVLLLAGLVYAAGAQALAQPRAAYVSGALALASAGVWLAGTSVAHWYLFSLLIMGISAGGMALSAYNQSQSAAVAQELAAAWRRVARLTMGAAISIMAFQLGAPWIGHDAPVVPPSESITLAIQALISGILLLFLGKLDARPQYSSGAAAAWAAALVGFLESVNGRPDLYVLSFVIYAAALYAASHVVKRLPGTFASARRLGRRSPPGSASTINVAAGQYQAQHWRLEPWIHSSALAQSSKVAAALGIFGAAVLPSGGALAHWLFAAASLAIGGALLVAMSFAERSKGAAYGALCCFAYASALIMWRIGARLSLADMLAPFAVCSAIAALTVSWKQNADHSSKPQVSGLADLAASLWRAPLAATSLMAVLLSLANLIPSMVAETGVNRAAASVVPLLVASILVFASRREHGSDLARTVAAVLANLAGVLIGGLVVGLAGSPVRWHIGAIERASVFWLIQAWIVWLGGSALSRRDALLRWGPDLIQNGLITGVLAGAACTLCACSARSPLAVWPISGLLAGAFLLVIAETRRADSGSARALSLLTVTLSAAAHGALVFAHSPFVETSWTLFALLAAAAYFALARQQSSVQTAWLTLPPLALGFALFMVWKRVLIAGAQAGLLDAHAVVRDLNLANPLWMAGGAICGLLYLKAADHLKSASFAYAAAIVAIVSYCHGLGVLVGPKPEWFPVLVLPFLACLYLYGIYRAKDAPHVGDPFRHAALASAMVAAIFVTGRLVLESNPVTALTQLPAAGAMAAVFALMTAEAYRTGDSAARTATLIIVGMAAICFSRTIVRSTPFPATMWVLFVLVAAASYFQIARRVERPAHGALAIWPLLLGYTLLTAWKSGRLLVPMDAAVANWLVVLGGLGVAAAYFDIARRSKVSAFAYLSGGLLIATYAHALGIVWRPQPDWFLLALLPSPLAIYLCGARMYNDRPYLGEPWRFVGMGTVFAGALFVTARCCAGFGAQSPDSVLPGGLFAASAFVLAAIETYRTAAQLPRILTFAALGLAGLIFETHSHTGVPGFATAWTVTMFCACAIYFAIARREQTAVHSYAPLLPVTLGYLLFSAWRSRELLSAADTMCANVAWVFGVAGAAIAYASTARQRQSQTFAYLGAVLLVSSYTHLLTILDPHERHVERYALLVLPLLAGMYAYGVMRQTDEFAGRPFRRVALALSGVALLFSTVSGDHLLPIAGQAIDHALITLTLAAYGLAYSGIALVRRTPGTIATASTTLTLAYLHALLAMTSFWLGHPSILSWPRFAALESAGGVVWIGLAWFSLNRLRETEYARPLQAIAAALAILCGVVVFSSGGLAAALLHGDGGWALAALGVAGALWVALWAQQVGEACWHIGVWYLLAGWALAIRLYLPNELDGVDLYILPLSAYLLAAGHRSGDRDRAELSRALWWIGLIVLMAPPFMLFWGRSPGAHHVPILIAECAAATLWGIFRRIRAYVSAGFAFVVLLTVASWFRNVDNVAGTISALVIGVGLFVYVYYWVTHRVQIESWLHRASGAWRMWRAWR